MKVLIVEQGKKPYVKDIENNLESMQKIVGGYIETIYPFDDENVVLVCNEEGKMNGLPLNRAIYGENSLREVSYQELKTIFRETEKKGESHIKGYITFTADSFTKPYTEEQRTYVISSDNKAFLPNKGGYSIYGSSIDGTDLDVRLERYMADETGDSGYWKIEKCSVETPTKNIVDIIAGTFFLCYAPADSENFLGLPDNLIERYSQMFELPERFGKIDGKIVAKKYEPEDNSVQEKFIECLKFTRDYWLSLPNKSPKEIVDGVLFSLLVMIDGDSGTNDFHSLKIIDEETGERIDCGYLHELYYSDKEENKNVLKETELVANRTALHNQLTELQADLEDLNDFELTNCRDIMLERVNRCMELILETDEDNIE